MACSCTVYDYNGNPVNQIPVKVGEPLSTACERVTAIGSIPEVIRYAGFTLVAGAPVGGIVSNGGIANPKSFFASRTGCYQDMDARVASTCA